MNFVRSLITFFILILLALTVAGWVWAGGQPSPQLEGARIALAGSGLAGIVGLVVVWGSDRSNPAREPAARA